MPMIKLKSSSVIDSVDLRGIPTVPDAFPEIATTQMVQQEISNLVNSAPVLLNTLGELAKSLGEDNTKTQ